MTRPTGRCEVECVHLHLAYDRRTYIRCHAFALKDSEWCWAHDPSEEGKLRRQRAAARSRITSRKQPPPGSGKPAPGEEEAVGRWMKWGGGVEAFAEFDKVITS